MIIVTTESGFKKAINQKEDQILIQGNLATILSNCILAGDQGLEAILASGVFGIEKDILNYYKCSANVNALMHFLENYTIISFDEIKQYLKIQKINN